MGAVVLKARHVLMRFALYYPPAKGGWIFSTLQCSRHQNFLLVGCPFAATNQQKILTSVSKIVKNVELCGGPKVKCLLYKPPFSVP